MTHPTRQDALDAADVFFTALNSVLYRQERKCVDSHAVAQVAASLRASVIAATIADAMGVDADRLERVAAHLVKRRVAEQEKEISAGLLERLTAHVDKSDALKN